MNIEIRRKTFWDGKIFFFYVWLVSKWFMKQEILLTPDSNSDSEFPCANSSLSLIFNKLVPKEKERKKKFQIKSNKREKKFRAKSKKKMQFYWAAMFFHIIYSLMDYKCLFSFLSILIISFLIFQISILKSKKI